jgi:hypothetical protein
VIPADELLLIHLGQATRECPASVLTDIFVLAIIQRAGRSNNVIESRHQPGSGQESPSTTSGRVGERRVGQTADLITFFSTLNFSVDIGESRQACRLIRNSSGAGNRRFLDGPSFPPTPKALPKIRHPLPPDPRRVQGVVSPLPIVPSGTPSRAAYF